MLRKMMFSKYSMKCVYFLYFHLYTYNSFGMLNFREDGEGFICSAVMAILQIVVIFVD